MMRQVYTLRHDMLAPKPEAYNCTCTLAATSAEACEIGYLYIMEP